MIKGFQRGAFQRRSFQMEETAVTPRSGGVPTFKYRIALPDQYRGEDEEEKRLRRIREGTLPAPVVPVEIPAPDYSAYFARSAKLASSISRLHAQSADLRRQIAKLEAAELERMKAAERDKVGKQLTVALQSLQLAYIQEAVLLEEIEAIDVAFAAVAVLYMTMQ